MAEPDAVALIAIGSDGAGAGKKSRGPYGGGVILLGNPHPPRQCPLWVVEGIADARLYPHDTVALSTTPWRCRRHRGAVAVVLRTRAPDALAEWNAAADMVIHADKDGPGILRMAIPLQTKVKSVGGSCRIVYHGGGANDAADTTAAVGFPSYDARP